MKVFGIDPGYGRCGVAVVEKVGGKDTLIFSDCIETTARDEFADRLAAVTDACNRIIEEHRPEAIALERLYFQKNQKTAMRVAEVRGSLINMAAQHEIPLFEYTPGQIKSAAAGFGGADKAAVIRMMHLLLKIDKKIRHDDEYDAIAIGITHLAHSRVQ